jgi:hypothetical protein
VVAAATELARHRMGALIAFEQDANVLEFVKSEGIPLDCVVTRELLVSLFVPESVNKLHDGAVLIRDLKIARAGVFFPMPDAKILDAQLGSRHRAALGITEETDAVVVVVSEERGTISFCFSGNIVSNLDGQSLRHALLGLFGRAGRKKRPKKLPAPVAATTRSSPQVRTSVVHPPTPADAPKPAQPMPSASTPLKTPPATKLVTSTPMKPAAEPQRPSLTDAAPSSTQNPTATSTPAPRSTFVPVAMGEAPKPPAQPAPKRPGEES